jgi:hypothetical protein
MENDNHSWGSQPKTFKNSKIGDSGHKVKVGSQLPQAEKERLVAFLHENKDMFAWSHEDMPGIDLAVIVHKLNVDPNHRPIKQRRSHFCSRVE